MVIVFALALLSGCAARKPRADRYPQYPMSQEEVEARRTGFALADVQRQELWKEQLNLQCPAGGRENVIIGSRLGRDAFRVGGSRVAKFFLARYMGLVEITNPYNETVDIKEGGRPFVYNMCPNGTITVVAVLGFLAGTSGAGGYYSQDFVWTASRYVDGHQYYGVSDRMTLYAYQWEQEKKGQWVMRIEDIDRSLPEHPRGR